VHQYDTGGPLNTLGGLVQGDPYEAYRKKYDEYIKIENPTRQQYDDLMQLWYRAKKDEAVQKESAAMKGHVTKGMNQAAPYVAGALLAPAAIATGAGVAAGIGEALTGMTAAQVAA